MPKFGLIGASLKHSQSPDIFNNIFNEAGFNDYSYNLYPLKNLKELNKLLTKDPEIQGLNVTIPFKKDILSYLYEIDPTAIECWAVNTIVVSKLKGRVLLKGYNTDMPAFKESLQPLLDPQHKKALIFGTGGAASAAKVALKQLGVDFTQVSRNPKFEHLGYADVDASVIRAHKLLVNCTPLGMYPDIETCVEIPFNGITESHLVYDMVYNPKDTVLLKRAKNQGAKTKSGLEMLELQAKKAWEIWQEG